MSNKKKDEEKRKKRIIIYIIIIIIIILALLTSCSCTSELMWKIGNLFKNEGNYIIDDKTNDKQIIKNKDLRFELEQMEAYSTDDKIKVSFYIDNINPKEIKCYTSDAEIATCYVKDDYVVINPKKTGKITVFAEAEANGKKYQATVDVDIKEGNKYILLSKKQGTLNLNKSSKYTLNYSLVGIKGTPKVSSDDDKIATAKVEKNKIVITGHKTGSTTITVTLDYNGRTYTKEFIINVVRQEVTQSGGTTTKPSGDSKPSGSNKPSGGSSSGSGSTTPGNNTGNEGTGGTSDPGNGGTTNPGTTDPNPGTDPSTPKSDDSSLRNLSTSIGNINYDKDTYQYKLNVVADNITVTAEKNDSKATLSYKFNDNTVTSLENLNLINGNNTVVVTVTAEDDSTSDYVVVIKKNYMNPETTDKKINLVAGTAQGTVILNSNIFDDSNFTKTTISTSNGIKLTSQSNSNAFVNITSVSPKLTVNVDNTSATSSIAVKLTTDEPGTYKVHVYASIDGTKITEFDIDVTVIGKYVFTIKANGGFVNELTTDIEELVDSTDTIDLKNYKFYKVDITGNCMYYELESFNSKSDGTGTRYELTDTISTIRNNITIYAIYTEDSKLITDIENNNRLYLTDVKIFENRDHPEYPDSMIYPGAKGYYIMNFTNNSDAVVTLTGMEIEEENICIAGKGCLNMGYVVRYDKPSSPYYYYLGNAITSDSNYVILNDSTSTTNTKDISFAPEVIELQPGDSASINLFWKWIEINDSLDTAIGIQANDNINNEYNITVSIKFGKVKKYCNLP